mgnify:CR=1 FL=1
MAKILEFPIKKQLSEKVEELIHETAEAYIRTLNYALTVMSSDHPSQEELQEIHELVMVAYAEGIDKAIKKIEKGL